MTETTIEPATGLVFIAATDDASFDTGLPRVRGIAGLAVHATRIEQVLRAPWLQLCAEHGLEGADPLAASNPETQSAIDLFVSVRAFNRFAITLADNYSPGALPDREAFLMTPAFEPILLKLFRAFGPTTEQMALIGVGDAPDSDRATMRVAEMIKAPKVAKRGSLMTTQRMFMPAASREPGVDLARLLARTAAFRARQNRGITEDNWWLAPSSAFDDAASVVDLDAATPEGTPLQ